MHDLVNGVFFLPLRCSLLGRGLRLLRFFLDREGELSQGLRGLLQPSTLLHLLHQLLRPTNLA